MPRLRRPSEATYREDAHIVQCAGRILSTLAVRHPTVLSLQMATRMVTDAQADLELPRRRRRRRAAGGARGPAGVRGCGMQYETVWSGGEGLSGYRQR